MKELYISGLKQLLSAQLIQYRRTHGLSQAQLAERLGIEPRSYIELEHGKSLCSTPVFLRFLLLCGDDPAGLLHEIRSCLDDVERSLR